MLDLLAAGTDPALVDFQIDIYWALVAGADPVALIARHAGRVPTLHAKELAAGTATSPGTRRSATASTPWPELLAAATARRDRVAHRRAGRRPRTTPTGIFAAACRTSVACWTQRLPPRTAGRLGTVNGSRG